MNYTDWAIDKTVELMKVPSPGGFTRMLRDQLEEELKGWGLEVTRTKKGLIYATIRGRDDENHRVVTAHIDTLGGMIREIKPNGRPRLTNVGGAAWQSDEGENLTIFTRSGKTYTGTLLPDKASVHIWSEEARLAERNEETMEVRIDADTKSAEETEALGIRVGDFVAFETRTVIADNGYIKSRYLDDKAIVGVMMAVMRQILDQNEEIAHTTHFMFSDYEEMGHGAYGFPEKSVEILALDIGTVGSYHTSDEKKVTIVAKDSRTAYDYDFRKRLEDLAEENGIPYATDVHFRYGSDACASMLAGEDMNFACIGLGVDATHHYERTHRDGFTANIDLLRAYLFAD